MPGMDGTGPFGTGRPGRGLGPCRLKYPLPAGNYYGRCYPLGARRGWRGYVPPGYVDDDAEGLESYVNALEKELAAARKRLDALRGSNHGSE